MIRRELTLVNHRIEHLDEYQVILEKNLKKKKKENMVLQVKSPLSRHNDLRRRIGFDTTDIPDVNSITESDNSSRIWRIYSPNQWNYSTPDNAGTARATTDDSMIVRTPEFSELSANSDSTWNT